MDSYDEDGREGDDTEDDPSFENSKDISGLKEFSKQYASNFGQQLFLEQRSESCSCQNYTSREICSCQYYDDVENFQSQNSNGAIRSGYDSHHYSQKNSHENSSHILQSSGCSCPHESIMQAEDCSDQDLLSYQKNESGVTSDSEDYGKPGMHFDLQSQKKKSPHNYHTLDDHTWKNQSPINIQKPGLTSREPSQPRRQQIKSPQKLDDESALPGPHRKGGMDSRKPKQSEIKKNSNINSPKTPYQSRELNASFSRMAHDSFSNFTLVPATNPQIHHAFPHLLSQNLTQQQLMHLSTLGRIFQTPYSSMLGIPGVPEVPIAPNYHPIFYPGIPYPAYQPQISQVLVAPDQHPCRESPAHNHLQNTPTSHAIMKKPQPDQNLEEIRRNLKRREKMGEDSVKSKKEYSREKVNEPVKFERQDFSNLQEARLLSKQDRELQKKREEI